MIVCNMNNGTVEFTDFDGTVSLTLPNDATGGPKTFDSPALATLLLGIFIPLYSKKTSF